MKTKEELHQIRTRLIQLLNNLDNKTFNEIKAELSNIIIELEEENES